MFSAIGGAVTKVGGIFSSVFGAIKTVVTTLWGVISAHPVIAVITAIIGVVVLLYNKCEWFRNAINAILKWIWGFIVNVVTSIKNFIFKTIPDTIMGIIDWFAKLPDRIWNTLTSVVNSIMDWGANLGRKGADAAKKLFNAVVNGIKSLPKKMLSIGGDLVKGIWNGISDMTSWIIDKIGGFADSVVDSICSFFGIHSPSRVMKKLVGKNLVAGIGEGIIDNESLALRPLKQLQTEMTSSFNPNVSASVTRALNYNGTITVESPINIDLDGKPIYKNVVRRTTQNQSSRTIFQGGM